MENLLQVLKLDSTILIQFIIFLVTYLALYFLVFKPYMKAFEKRKEATVGSQELAEQLALETQNIHFKFESKAREINSQIKNIFDGARKEATKLQEEIVYKAREESEELVKKAREEIRKNVATVRDELKKQVPEISQSISNRLLGKETH